MKNFLSNQKGGIFAGVIVAVLVIIGITGGLVIVNSHTKINACWFCGDQGTQSQEAMLTEQNQQQLDKAQPPKTYNYSQERENLVKRLDTLNKQNVIGYVYLLGANGQVVASYTTHGKVSSLNSYLTTTIQYVDSSGAQCNPNNTHEPGGCYQVDSPDLDGSYGSNPQGIFFFTDTGALVEWSGPYLWSNSPLHINTPVSLVQQVNQ